MEKKKIIIDNELCNYIEATQYDLEGIKQLLLSIDLQGTSKDIIDYWKDNYLTKFKEYTLAKQEIEKVIKESGVVDASKGFSWNLDFSTNEVVIDQ